MAFQKNAPSWSDVKARLVSFDGTGLIGLIQDLYAANKDNRVSACPIVRQKGIRQVTLERAAQALSKPKRKRSD